MPCVNARLTMAEAVALQWAAESFRAQRRAAGLERGPIDDRLDQGIEALGRNLEQQTGFVPARG